MENATPPWMLFPMLGGALIGLSASLLLVFDGRVAGVSGIVGGLLVPRRGDAGWRAAFVAGLVFGGLAIALRWPDALAPGPSQVPLVALAAAGWLVGFGTQLSGGCTSGHGVCGLARLSRRSLVAVATFMATGALAAFVSRHLLPRLM